VTPSNLLILHPIARHNATTTGCLPLPLLTPTIRDTSTFESHTIAVAVHVHSFSPLLLMFFDFATHLSLPSDFASHRPSQCNNNRMPSSSFVDNQTATLLALFLPIPHNIARRSAQPWDIPMVDNHFPSFIIALHHG